MNRETQASEKKPSALMWLFDFGKSAIVALLLVILIRTFVAQPFVVSGQSMDPTFVENEYMIIDELSYRFTEPQRGDVIVFKYPKNPSVYYIKRIIGLPGETIEVKEGNVFVYNQDGTFQLTEPYVMHEDTRSVAVRQTLGEDEYFVLGDNRPVSADSRMWGSVPKKNIVGKPFITLYPFSRIDIRPGV